MTEKRINKKKLNIAIDRAIKHGWCIRNYDSTYTYMGRDGANGRTFALAITRSTGRVFSN